MTFEQWWATLTDAEHRVIGKHNARYVWNEACEACAKVCESLWNYPDNGMATEEECYGNKCATAIRARGKT
jgi:hypothetical protein